MKVGYYIRIKDKYIFMNLFGCSENNKFFMYLIKFKEGKIENVVKIECNFIIF